MAILSAIPIPQSAIFWVLIQEQILSPALIRHADKMANERNVRWQAGFSQQRKTRLLRGSIALQIVALEASADQVVPGVHPSLRPRNHVIDRHPPSSRPTIVALMTVPFKHIPLGERELLLRDSYIEAEAYDARDREPIGNRPDKDVELLDDLRAPPEDQNDGPPYAAHLDGLITLVEDQNGLIED